MSLRDGVLLLIYPFSLSLLLIIGIGLRLVRQRRWMAGLLLVTATWLWLCATPAVSLLLRLPLERPYPVESLPAIPRAAAIAVLGGAITPAQPPYRPYPSLHGDSDRLWHAARLYHAGKAPLIFAVGGGRAAGGQPLPEAKAMVTFLTDLGVPPEAIVTEGASLSTCENARFGEALLTGHGIDRILLVTSAYHLPRALATFRSAGIEAVPVAANAATVPERFRLRDWLPDAGTLSASSRILREYLALLVYWLKGWDC